MVENFPEAHSTIPQSVCFMLESMLNQLNHLSMFKLTLKNEQNNWFTN